MFVVLLKEYEDHLFKVVLIEAKILSILKIVLDVFYRYNL